MNTPPAQRAPEFSLVGAWSFGAKLLNPRFFWLPLLLQLAAIAPTIFFSAAIPVTRGTPSTEEAGRILAILLGLFVSLIWSIVLSMLTSAVVLRAAFDMTKGVAPRARIDGQDISLAIRLFAAGLLLGLGSALPVGIVFFGTIAIFVIAWPLGVAVALVALAVGFYIYSRLSMAPALLREGFGIIDAYQESWRIARRSMWRVVLWILANLVLTITLTILAALVRTIVPVVGGLTSALVTAVMLPLTYGVMVTLVYACRWRLATIEPELGNQFPPPAPAMAWPTYEPPSFDAPPPAPAPETTPAPTPQSAPEQPVAPPAEGSSAGASSWEPPTNQG